MTVPERKGVPALIYSPTVGTGQAVSHKNVRNDKLLAGKNIWYQNPNINELKVRVQRNLIKATMEENK